MQPTLRWLYRKLGARYFPLFLAFEWGSAAIITLATVGLFTLYEDMSTETFLRLLCVGGAISLKGKRDPVPIYAVSVLDERPTPATTGLIAEA